MNFTEIKLTAYSKGSGCGCKIAPEALKKILATSSDLPKHPSLLVGYDTSDDAAIMAWNEEECLISTTDFFMPMVDDARTFGKIAAANAISDVFAMGGTPMLAVAILGWPIDKLPLEMANEVLEGARFTCQIAGIPLAGGHSIDSPEPFFGLAVNGKVFKNNIKKNNTANVGDKLFLSKPLGVGMMSTAHKRGLLSSTEFEDATSYMMALNDFGKTLGKYDFVSAMTDVTGFGLLGHTLEMCDQSRLSAILDYSKIPVLSKARGLAGQMIYPDMTMKNFSAQASQCVSLTAEQMLILCDPQTSGGLLVAVDPIRWEEYNELVVAHGLQGIADQCIGEFVAPRDKTILLSP